MRKREGNDENEEDDDDDEAVDEISFSSPLNNDPCPNLPKFAYIISEARIRRNFMRIQGRLGLQHVE